MEHCFYCKILSKLALGLNKMNFQVDNILDVTGGMLLLRSNAFGSFSISTDTRTVSEKDIFLPLVGPNFDGHDFIAAAVGKGVKGYFLDKKHKRITDDPVQDICSRPMTHEDYSQYESQYVEDALINNYEKQFFIKVADKWNKNPDVSDKFYEFILKEYNNRIEHIKEASK